VVNQWDVFGKRSVEWKKIVHGLDKMGMM